MSTQQHLQGSETDPVDYTLALTVGSINKGLETQFDRGELPETFSFSSQLSAVTDRTKFDAEFSTPYIELIPNETQKCRLVMPYYARCVSRGHLTIDGFNEEALIELGCVFFDLKDPGYRGIKLNLAELSDGKTSIQFRNEYGLYGNHMNYAIRTVLLEKDWKFWLSSYAFDEAQPALDPPMSFQYGGESLGAGTFSVGGWFDENERVSPAAEALTEVPQNDEALAATSQSIWTISDLRMMMMMTRGLNEALKPQPGKGFVYNPFQQVIVLQQPLVIEVEVDSEKQNITLTEFTLEPVNGAYRIQLEMRMPISKFTLNFTGCIAATGDVRFLPSPDKRTINAEIKLVKQRVYARDLSAWDWVKLTALWAAIMAAALTIPQLSILIKMGLGLLASIVLGAFIWLFTSGKLDLGFITKAVQSELDFITAKLNKLARIIPALLWISGKKLQFDSIQINNNGSLTIKTTP